MSAIQLKVIPHQTKEGLPYQHLQIQLTATDGIITPGDLKGLKLPAETQFKQGIVIEGRAPLWLYGYLVHECHAAAWVACFDPRLGAVVVATHTHDVAISQVLDVEIPNQN